MSAARDVDVVVIGGGHAGLAAAFYLRRTNIDFLVFDAQAEPGGAWGHGWFSLRLFSPAQYSSLPGWPMPPQPGEPYPTASQVVDYLRAYEQRYHFPILRPARVRTVRNDGDRLCIDTEHGEAFSARIVISATGTWWRPYVPHYPGQRTFTGRQLHAADYRDPAEFAGQNVVVVGGGNSAAQILAEISGIATTRWVTTKPPRLLPDDVDGRVLFGVASRHYLARKAGEDSDGVAGLGDIVAVASVREARDRGVLHAEPMFTHLDPDGPVWADGRRDHADAIIWCTGFRPALNHLAPLGLRGPDGHIATVGTRARDDDRVFLLGYGDWTGPASATIVGAGRTAKAMVADIAAHLAGRGAAAAGPPRSRG
jgi:putative flavoprotein involved in K+ transport